MFLLALTLLMFGTKIGNLIADWVQFGEVFRIGWNIGLVPVILFLLILAIALVYYLTPDVEQNWKWISPGAVIAIPGWIVMSLAFSFYINNFGSYNKTYGSIGAVIVLLLWLYLSGSGHPAGCRDQFGDRAQLSGGEGAGRKGGDTAEREDWFFRVLERRKGKIRCGSWLRTAMQ